MNKVLISALLVLCMWGVSFGAGRESVTREYPWVMRSVAALGMGDAFYTKSDSKYAPFYNPAGLARIKKWNVDIIPVTLGVNSTMIEMYQDFTDADLDNDSEVAELIASKIGEYDHADVSVYPSFTKKNFTIGIFGSTQATVIPANPVLPELDVDATADVGAVVGASMGFLEDRLQVGLAGRYQQRRSVLRVYTFHDIASGELNDDNLSIDILDKGWDVIIDAGLIYNFAPKSFLDPRVGLAVNNMGISGMGDARGIPYSVNVSVGISPSYKIITSDIILDIRDITQNFEQDKDWAKRVNAGAELRFFERVALRGGIHQGYLTAGAGLDLTFLRLNYAYYKEEIGAYAGQKADTRHALEMIIGF